MILISSILTLARGVHAEVFPGELTFFHFFYFQAPVGVWKFPLAPPHVYATDYSNCAMFTFILILNCF